MSLLQTCSSPPRDVLTRAIIADELDRIRDLLEDMGVELCGNPQVVRAHLAALQTIDEICQRNENLARTLRAEDMAAEADTITLESLRARLQGAMAERRVG
jgi:hypothetical protein